MSDSGRTQVRADSRVEPEFDSSSVIELTSGEFATVEPEPRRRRGGWLGWSGWLLWVFTLLAIAAFLYLYAYPFWLKSEQLKQVLAQNVEVVDDLRRAGKQAENTIDDLQKRNAVLEQEVEVKAAALAEVQQVREELAAKLAKEIKRGDVLVSERRGVLVVDLVDKILFDSGQAELNDRGRKVLARVSESLTKVPDKVIQVAGHTDALPISDKLAKDFPTNWELSTARATHVVRFLQ
ncbi:MAG: OmpA family protein, partial [Myxococcota bacterium]